MKKIVYLILCVTLTMQVNAQITSTYQPFTFEEMLAPVQIATNAHREAQDKLNNDFLSGNEAWLSKNYPRALQLFLSCNTLNNRFDGNLVEQNVLELNIAHCYYKMEDYANARDWFYKAMINGHESAREWYEDARNLAETSNKSRTSINASTPTKITKGQVSVSDFFTLTGAMLSQFSTILRDRDFSLQYTRNKNDDDYNYMDIAWGYNAWYEEDTNSFAIMSSFNPAIVKMMYDGETPLIVMYSFTQMSIFNDFQNNLHKWGYKKTKESIDSETQGIVVEFKNGTSSISLKESAASSWKYTIEWADIP